MKKDKPITSIALFQGLSVRKVWHEDRWFYSIIDVIAILTQSPQPRKYWNTLKTRLLAEGGSQLSSKWRQLKMESADGKHYLTDAADSTDILRIIQSVPSPRAEPFKLWLAEVGNERLQEIENPELAMERMKALYEAKGYPSEWIEKRMRGIAVRNELTDEWERRGAEEGREYAILTNEIAQATFGVGVQEHKGVKLLKQQHNLRDHMTDLELILTMLGEATSTHIHRDRDSEGFDQLQVDARRAGEIAGHTRKEIEAETGTPVVSPTNYLELGRKKQMRLKQVQQPSLLNAPEGTDEDVS